MGHSDTAVAGESWEDCDGRRGDDCVATQQQQQQQL